MINKNMYDQIWRLVVKKIKIIIKIKISSKDGQFPVSSSKSRLFSSYFFFFKISSQTRNRLESTKITLPFGGRENHKIISFLYKESNSFKPIKKFENNFIQCPKTIFFYMYFLSKPKKKMSNEKTFYICHQTLTFGRPENQKINS